MSSEKKRKQNAKRQDVQEKQEKIKKPEETNRKILLFLKIQRQK